MNLLIKNGHLLDPAHGIDEVGGLSVFGDTIAGDLPESEAEYVVDAAGCYVLPGLIDYHTHISRGGNPIAVQPDLLMAHGVTTAVDAGSTGCANFEQFYRTVVVNSQIRIRSYLHLFPPGQPGCGIKEDFSSRLHNEEKLQALFRRYPNHLLGFKIRMGAEVVGEGNMQPLYDAVGLAQRLGKRLVCHVTNPPVSSAATARALRTGDVYCHCYHGTGPTILDGDGGVLPEIRDARRRGVYMDACSGYGNFSHRVAQAAIRDGFLPDIISTDMTQLVFNRNGFSKSLPYVMGKFLALGMNFPDVAAAVTSTPARLLGMEGTVGTLRTGGRADLFICRKARRKVKYRDALGDEMEGDVLLVPLMTIKGGQAVFASIDF